VDGFAGPFYSIPYTKGSTSPGCFPTVSGLTFSLFILTPNVGGFEEEGGGGYATEDSRAGSSAHLCGHQWPP